MSFILWPIKTELADKKGDLWFVYLFTQKYAGNKLKSVRELHNED